LKLPREFFDISGNIRIESPETSEGTPISMAHIPHCPTESFILTFRDGVAYEPEDLWGISHFAEHILFRGTEEIPTLYDISRKVEGIGGRISAYSMRDMVSFFIKTPPGHEETALYVLEQLILHPALKPKHIGQEKAIIHQERLREINNPAFLNSLMVENLLLFPSPISRHPVGDDNVIEKMNPGILRKYIRNAYHGKNLYMAVSGNLGNKIIPGLNGLVSRFPGGSARSSANFELTGDFGGARVFHLYSHHKNQVYLSIGWKFKLKSREELFAWRAIVSMLGSGYTSILNLVLREKENLTYLCTTNFNYYEDTAIFKLNLALDEKNLERALESIEGIIDDIKGMRFDADIFNEALIRHASHLLFRMEDSLEVSKILAHTLVREGQAFSFEEYFRSLENVTVEFASNLAGKNLLDENRIIFIQTGSQAVERSFPDAFKLQKVGGSKIQAV